MVVIWTYGHMMKSYNWLMIITNGGMSRMQDMRVTTLIMKRKANSNSSQSLRESEVLISTILSRETLLLRQ